MSEFLTQEEFQIKNLNRENLRLGEEILDLERRIDNLIYWIKILKAKKINVSQTFIQSVIDDRGNTDRPKLREHYTLDEKES